MPRTRKSAAAAAETVIVPIRPELEEAGADAEPQDLVEPTLDEEAPAEEPSEPQPRGRGPALNRAELIGRIAKGPELRITPSGMHVASFRVATNGREEKDTEFHQCTAFGKTAEFVAEYLRAGRLVHLEGRLQTREWVDRDGIRRWMTGIVVHRLQALDSRRQSEQ